MDYEKVSEKFSYGFGSAKTAGKGTLADAQEAPDVRTKHDKKAIAQSAAKAAAAVGLIVLKKKLEKKKK